MFIVEFIPTPLAVDWHTETVFAGNYKELIQFFDKECDTVLPELKAEVVNMALVYELSNETEYISEHYRISTAFGRHIRPLCDQA